MKLSQILAGLALLLAGSALAAGAHDHHGDMPSVHGMLVFGSNKLYLSHLPMFHAPHDYQAIVEAELGSAAMQAYRASHASHPEETVYTLVPEKFSLPEMMSSPRPFKAVLYRGHFERGGTPIAEVPVVTIRKVLHFSKLNAAGPAPAVASYLLFGSPGELFLAHRISARPDFDQVARVSANSDVSIPTQVQDTAVPVEIPSVGDSDTLQAGNVISATGETSLELSIDQSLYVERDDLSF